MIAEPRSLGLSHHEPGDPGTLLFENDRVRIWELILGPGQSCHWHVHPYDHLLVVFSGAKIEGETADGTAIHLDIDDHRTYFVPRSAQPEVARNVSPDRVLRELIIDLKDPAGAATDFAVFDFFQPGTLTTAR